MSKLLEVNYAGVVSLPGSRHVQTMESYIGGGLGMRLTLVVCALNVTEKQQIAVVTLM